MLMPYYNSWYSLSCNGMVLCNVACGVTVWIDCALLLQLVQQIRSTTSPPKIWCCRRWRSLSRHRACACTLLKQHRPRLFQVGGGVWFKEYCYLPQQCLYFFPLPHLHGTFFGVGLAIICLGDGVTGCAGLVKSIVWVEGMRKEIVVSLLRFVIAKSPNVIISMPIIKLASGASSNWQACTPVIRTLFGSITSNR